MGSLRTVLEAATHRAAAVLPDDLWKLLANPEAPAEARAAAAVVLAPALDEAGKERLRETAASIASTHLRVVLESAASGDEEAMQQALEELAPRGTAGEGAERERGR